MTNTHTAKLQQRYKELLPRTRDLSLLVLKGHLCIEEQIDALLEASCDHPRDLQDARLTFHQKMCITRALGAWPKHGPFWPFVKGLTRLRNKLAHRLEQPSLKQDVDAVLKTFWGEEYKEPTSDQNRATVLRNTIGFMGGFLAGSAIGRKERLAAMEASWRLSIGRVPTPTTAVS